jgi:hypothetical protein
MWDWDDIEVMHLDFGERGPDPRQEEAREALERFFNDNRERVFFSRQVEVLFEGSFFHWVTNRALHDLLDVGVLSSEMRRLKWGGSIHLLWHRGYRYYKRSATRVVELVEEYSDPNVGGALGLQGESIVLEGFARERFVLMGREVNKWGERVWTQSEHDLDFVFEREGQSYGVEVKNTLGYPDYTELKTKIAMALHLGLVPVSCVRMLPKSWVKEVNDAGGFALVMKYQLYPWGHRELARRVAVELQLPVDAPRALADGTMARFVRWQEGHV